MNKPLRIKGAGDLVVPDDVTPLEAARLAEFLVKMQLQPPLLKNPQRQAEQVAKQVEAHGLGRLFKEPGS